MTWLIIIKWITIILLENSLLIIFNLYRISPFNRFQPKVKAIALIPAAVTQHTTACCSMQVVYVTLTEHRSANITSLRVVQQKHCGSNIQHIILHITKVLRKLCLLHTYRIWLKDAKRSKLIFNMIGSSTAYSNSVLAARLDPKVTTMLNNYSDSPSSPSSYWMP